MGETASLKGQVADGEMAVEAARVGKPQPNRNSRETICPMRERASGAADGMSSAMKRTLMMAYTIGSRRNVSVPKTGRGSAPNTGPVRLAIVAQ